MNPDQPSREQIEARLTALLLGELPAAEAELLRWTISQDPELQKLHDQLKATIGFVREAMKNPTGAPLDRETPLKLAQERRQTLLTHFKTARPQPPQKPFWRRQIRVSPLIGAFAVVAIIALLAAMLLPVGNMSKSMRITASMQGSETTLSFNDMGLSSRSAAKEHARKAHSLSAGEDQAKTKSQEPPVAPTPAPIALPNTESSQTESEQNATGVYSQNVVGYVNIGPGASSSTSSSISSAPTQIEPRTGLPESETNSLPTFAFADGNSTPPKLESGTASPFAARLPSASSEMDTAPMPSTPPPATPPPAEQIPPTGLYTVSAGDLSKVVETPRVEPPRERVFDSLGQKAAVNGNNFHAGNRAAAVGGAGAIPSSASANNMYGLWEAGASRVPSQAPANSQSNGNSFEWFLRNSIDNEVVQNGLRNAAHGAPHGQYFKFPDGSSSPYVTNAIQPQDFNGFVNSPLIAREEPNAKVIDNDDRMVAVEHPPILAPPPAGTGDAANLARVGIPPQSQQQYAQRLESVEHAYVKPVPTNGTPWAWAANDYNLPEGSSSGNEMASDIETLKTKYQAEVAQIQLDQSKVDQLRKQYGIHDTGNSTTPTPTIDSEQMQRLNEKLIEQKALVTKEQKEFAEFQSVQATNPTQLAGVLMAINPDTQLSDLLGKLHENEQRLVEDRSHLGASNSDVTSTRALNNTLQQEIADRVNGIMFGFKGQVDAGQAQMDALNQQVKDFELADQNELEAGQPYWHAKERLQSEQDLHKLLEEKIEIDESESAIPKNALVTIVNPAQPGQSQNLWQRLTGEVESQTRIEIQPDITSDAPTAYAPYDPYFLETEINSIQSDAVLGKVVDALKLDQAWSKQDDGEKLSRKDAIALLRSRLDLQTIQNTKLINIGAKSDKPEEAAKIANAVADAYKQYRLETHSNEMAAGIRLLHQRYADEDKEIRQLQAGLQRMEAPKTVRQADMPVTPPPANAPIPQPEVQTSDNAFSTFAMNVSDVSFKLAMASLEKGRMPDPASIRSEEFINAFDYHDPEPLQGEPLSFMSERARDPFAHERDFLRFSIKAAAAGRQNGRALNLVLLLDTSGSMERADRVAIIREALRVLSAQLQPHDIVSVVTFARTARLWADGIPGDQAGATLDKVDSITPEGGTNLEEAMRLAYETALRHFIAGGMNRVVLLTDGAANLGNVDPKALTQNVDSERRQGIALDCFGIGWDDYNDDLLEQLSSNGDGRYAFINSPDEAATEFAAKLAGALQVAAEDVKVQVEFNPNRVTAWRQIGYAKHQLTKEQFRDNSVAAGAIAAREAGNALYVIETRPDGEGPIATVRVRYRVPGTQDVRECSWLVDYTGPAPELAQSSPSMRLAVSAAEISEWMADSPFAQDVTPDELLNYLSGVPQFYGADKRPQQLEWLIREIKSLSGK